MTANVGLTFDGSGWQEALSRLSGDNLTSIARSMAVAGGQFLRDEAKHYCPVQTGRLRDSIYLAFKDAISTDAQVVYSVSWNSREAPHGHLIEFGHFNSGGGWTAAQPFLRPAYDHTPQAMEAMIRRGRERVSEVLGGS
jgi:hypothetical protein